MDEAQDLKEIERGIFSDQSLKSDFPWKNLTIGIGVVVIVVFLVYLTASSMVKSSDYKPLDLSAGKTDQSVAGASTQGEGPFGPPKNATLTPTKPVTPTPTVKPTVSPTIIPTSSPQPTYAPPTATTQPTATSAPTQTPTPTNTLTPTDTPTPTPTDTPTPTP